jgi:hypothetical protein
VVLVIVFFGSRPVPFRVIVAIVLVLIVSVLILINLSVVNIINLSAT